MSFLFRESYVMAPFPEVMLRVGCGWQQFFKNVVSTVPNFRKQSFISIVSRRRRFSKAYRPTSYVTSVAGKKFSV